MNNYNRSRRQYYNRPNYGYSNELPQSRPPMFPTPPHPPWNGQQAPPTNPWFGPPLNSFDDMNTYGQRSSEPMLVNSNMYINNNYPPVHTTSSNGRNMVSYPIPYKYQDSGSQGMMKKSSKYSSDSRSRYDSTKNGHKMGNRESRNEGLYTSGCMNHATTFRSSSDPAKTSVNHSTNFNTREKSTSLPALSMTAPTKPVTKTKPVTPKTAEKLPKKLDKTTILKLVNSTTKYEPAMQKLLREQRSKLTQNLRNKYNNDSSRDMTQTGMFADEEITDGIIPNFTLNLTEDLQFLQDALEKVNEDKDEVEETIHEDTCGEEESEGSDKNPTDLILLDEWNEGGEKDVNSYNNYDLGALEIPSNIDELQLPSDVSSFFNFTEIKEDSTSLMNSEPIGGQTFFNTVKINEQSESASVCDDSTIATTQLSPIKAGIEEENENTPINDQNKNVINGGTFKFDDDVENKSPSVAKEEKNLEILKIEDNRLSPFSKVEKPDEYHERSPFVQESMKIEGFTKVETVETNHPVSKDSIQDMVETIKEIGPVSKQALRQINKMAKTIRNYRKKSSANKRVNIKNTPVRKKARKDKVKSMKIKLRRERKNSNFTVSFKRNLNYFRQIIRAELLNAAPNSIQKLQKKPSRNTMSRINTDAENEFSNLSVTPSTSKIISKCRDTDKDLTEDIQNESSCNPNDPISRNTNPHPFEVVLNKSTSGVDDLTTNSQVENHTPDAELSNKTNEIIEDESHLSNNGASSSENSLEHSSRTWRSPGEKKFISASARRSDRRKDQSIVAPDGREEILLKIYDIDLQIQSLMDEKMNLYKKLVTSEQSTRPQSRQSDRDHPDASSVARKLDLDKNIATANLDASAEIRGEGDRINNHVDSSTPSTGNEELNGFVSKNHSTVQSLSKLDMEPGMKFKKDEKNTESTKISENVIINSKNSRNTKKRKRDRCNLEVTPKKSRLSDDNSPQNVNNLDKIHVSGRKMKDSQELCPSNGKQKNVDTELKKSQKNMEKTNSKKQQEILDPMDLKKIENSNMSLKNSDKLEMKKLPQEILEKEVKKSAEKQEFKKEEKRPLSKSRSVKSTSKKSLPSKEKLTAFEKVSVKQLSTFFNSDSEAPKKLSEHRSDKLLKNDCVHIHLGISDQESLKSAKSNIGSHSKRKKYESDNKTLLARNKHKRKTKKLSDSENDEKIIDKTLNLEQTNSTESSKKSESEKCANKPDGSEKSTKGSLGLRKIVSESQLKLNESDRSMDRNIDSIEQTSYNSIIKPCSILLIRIDADGYLNSKAKGTEVKKHDEVHLTDSCENLVGDEIGFNSEEINEKSKCIEKLEETIISMTKDPGIYENGISKMLSMEPLESHVTNTSSNENMDNSVKVLERFMCTGHTGSILFVKIFSESIISAGEDGKIYKYNVNNGDLIDSVEAHQAAITSFHIAKNKQNVMTIYTGSLDTHFKSFNFESLNADLVIKLDTSIQCMDADWGYIFIGTVSGHIHRFSMTTNLMDGEKQCVGEQAILAIKSTREGGRRVLIAAQRKELISIRDAMSGLLLRYITVSTTSYTIYSILLHDSIVYCGTNKKVVLGYDFTDGKLVREMWAGKGIVCLLEYRKLLFAGCYDGYVYVFDLLKNTQITKFLGPGGMILALEVMDNKVIIGSKNSGLEVRPIPEIVLEYLSEMKR